jgi:arylsulfatase A-like enzyme
MRAQVGLRLWIVLAAICVCACRAEPPRPRLVILYATCTVNKSYLSPYGAAPGATPHLARFGNEAAVFSSHQTEAGISGPAFASIYSGTQADRHGVFKHPKKLSDDLYLIFEAFADAGFDTHYWTAHVMSRPGLNYAQGVEPENIVHTILTGDDEHFLAILNRLRTDETYRAFVVTSFSVTHDPWDIENVDEFLARNPKRTDGITLDEIRQDHETFKANRIALQTRFADTVDRLGLRDHDITRLARSLEIVYESKIGLLDSYFGGVVGAVDAAGMAGESVIAFTADHGEALYEPGRAFNWTHAPDLAPEVINVPWIVRGHPDLVPARTIDDVTRSIDVYPTLVGLAGISLPPESGIAGVDLAPSLRGDTDFPALRAYSHGTLRHWQYFHPDRIENIWASLRVGELLYTWRRLDSRWSIDVRRIGPSGPETAGPPETAEQKAAARSLWKYRQQMIAAYQRRHPRAAARSKREALDRLNEEEADALRSLGYIE